MPKVTLITGAERRRRWSADEREQILAAVNAPGAVVAEVGRRWDVCTSLIYKWLREERQAARESGFTPVIVKSDAPRRRVRSARCGDHRGHRRCAGQDRRGRSGGARHGDLEGAPIMISVPSGVRVWLAGGVTDMRRGMNGLTLQIQEGLGRDPHAGDLFVFRGRRGDMVKILWHDGIGLSLYAKRLEHGRFIWPSPADGAVAITAAQLGYLLDAIDWRNPRWTHRPHAAG